MAPKIDCKFILDWAPRYEEKDDGDYDDIVKEVADELSRGSSISKRTFLHIWSWKGAMRAKRFLLLDEYDSRYAPALRKAYEEPNQRKLSVLINSTSKLPGIGAPTASTIIHFFHPGEMPIIDIRTVEVLYSANLISTKQRDLEH